jgi:hypothetical protein
MCAINQHEPWKLGQEPTHVFGSGEGPGQWGRPGVDHDRDGRGLESFPSLVKEWALGCEPADFDVDLDKLSSAVYGAAHILTNPWFGVKGGAVQRIRNAPEELQAPVIEPLGQPGLCA